MKQPASPAEAAIRAHQGASLPGEVSASSAVSQGPPALAGGPAPLDGWDSELEDAVRFAPRIGQY